MTLRHLDANKGWPGTQYVSACWRANFLLSLRAHGKQAIRPQPGAMLVEYSTAKSTILPFYPTEAESPWGLPAVPLRHAPDAQGALGHRAKSQMVNGDPKGIGSNRQQPHRVGKSGAARCATNYRYEKIYTAPHGLHGLGYRQEKAARTQCTYDTYPRSSFSPMEKPLRKGPRQPYRMAHPHGAGGASRSTPKGIDATQQGDMTNAEV